MKLIFASVVISVSFIVNSQSTIEFYPTKDTYINSVIADQVQGYIESNIAAAWTYKGTPGIGRSLIGFEVCDLPTDFQLLSAKLFLFYNPIATHAGHTTGNNQAKLYKITDNSWTESTTWASQPTFDLLTFAVVPASSTTSENYEIDVTNLVDNCLTSSTEVGFYLKIDVEELYASLVFASSNHPNPQFRPRLELTFTSDSTWCEDLPIDSESCINNQLFPNVFTPNSDIVNEGYFFELGDCEIDEFEINIFNRWGQVVFFSNQQDFVWDGKNHLTELNCPDGTYFYKLSGRILDKQIERHGFFHLIH